jgi:hypothetical protein
MRVQGEGVLKLMIKKGSWTAKNLRVPFSMIALSALVLLLFSAPITADEKLLDSQIEGLGAEIAKYIIHNPNTSPHYQWVWLILPEKSFPKLSGEIRKSMSKKYKVFSKADRLRAEANSDPNFLERGFIYEVMILKMEDNIAEIAYRELIAVHNHDKTFRTRLATMQIIKYEWIDSGWKVAHIGGIIEY